MQRAPKPARAREGNAVRPGVTSNMALGSVRRARAACSTGTIAVPPAGWGQQLSSKHAKSEFLSRKQVGILARQNVFCLIWEKLPNYVVIKQAWRFYLFIKSENCFLPCAMERSCKLKLNCKVTGLRLDLNMYLLILIWQTAGPLLPLSP